jgi:DNA-binding IclR family transcriptional regulator
MNQPTRVEPTVTTDGGSTRTLDRAFALLEAVALAGTGVGVSELAVSSGLDKGTVSRLLGSLRGLGYVQQSETDRRYVLGGRCLWLARQYQGSQVARQIAHPRLEELADQTAETVHFALLEGVQMIYVDEIKHDGPIQLKSSIGNRLRVDLAATGRAVLAQLDAVELGRILDAVEALVEPAQRDAYLSNLRLDLTGYQRAGWATVDRGDDITRIAAAVCDASGVPIGGVSVSGPTFRVHDRSMELAQLCTETAARISVDLGFRPAHQISQH